MCVRICVCCVPCVRKPRVNEGGRERLCEALETRGKQRRVFEGVKSVRREIGDPIPALKVGGTNNTRISREVGSMMSDRGN